MKIFTKRLILLVLLNATFAQVASSQGQSACKIADAVIEQASSIRNLKVKRKVPCHIHGKELVQKYLIDTIEQKIPAKRLQSEEIVYKALGMIPDEFAYKQGLVDLYVSQLAGYYDPDKKHYIMAGWMPDQLQATIAAHELTHALQDQYYNLDSFMKIESFSSDELLARSALVEGDATAVMYDYQRRLMGQGGIEKENDISPLLMQNVVGASLVGALGTVPQSLQMMLIFPYTSGLRFAHSLLRGVGYKALDKAFKNPPRSTEDVLHPEKYGRKDPKEFVTFTKADARDEQVPSDALLVFEDTFGEFLVSALLCGFEPNKVKVAEAGAGWGGDRVYLLEKSDKSYVIWLTAWDTDKDLNEFLELFREALKKRFTGSTDQNQFTSQKRSVSLSVTGKIAKIVVVNH